MTALEQITLTGSVNIDLLTASNGEAALILDCRFARGWSIKAVGMAAGESHLHLNFQNGMRIALNIPLAEDFAARLSNPKEIHLALVESREIAYLKQVPI